ncbi:class I SAM-dependent methyltransferase [Leptolyngbya sp. CCNP1308]|uniref:class I SAM-dependent DNA methyltransferase n=1 Tax=Leptolyngbya sp. CCNP1308 TaxID=3110255 RepID=UPI002B21E264|nr:class I SAM-dependent methyltransferase [Leptolyngbya sp. CCNP1308]MEA5447905.1 class I SAM-dependent methyltransferase [Leptolyngbya sp. CCNP1308]
MSVFNAYAQYYDLLYQDKDYKQEADFIQQLLQTHAPTAQRLLELGSGTGRHAEYLAERGYQVTGVERSEEMLARCGERQAGQSSQVAKRLSFLQGDLREVRLEQTFDCVLSLFHVISYQTSNADLAAAFATVAQHLKPGGVFIFDVWYGPAVLHDPPAVRVKRLRNESLAITRIAEPVLHPNDNIVDVNYQVLLQPSDTDTWQELRELHRMRYLFKPELELLLHQAGMDLVTCGEWMSDRPAGLDTWGVYFVAVKS